MPQSSGHPHTFCGMNFLPFLPLLLLLGLLCTMRSAIWTFMSPGLFSASSLKLFCVGVGIAGPNVANDRRYPVASSPGWPPHGSAPQFRSPPHSPQDSLPMRSNWYMPLPLPLFGDPLPLPHPLFFPPGFFPPPLLLLCPHQPLP